MHPPRIAVCLTLAIGVGACAGGTGVSPSPRPAPPIIAATTTTAPSPASTVTAPTTTLPATTTTTATTTLDRTAALREIRANEAGRIMVLEYHLIEEPEDRWSRTPDNLRADISRLIAGGYYPITASALARGVIDVPAGKTPVVLTFDDSSSGQCRYLPDGDVDADSACGILLGAAEGQPGEWSPAATFFVLLEVDVADRVKFGQPEIAERKMRDMVSWGMELGSHSISHFRLDQGTPEEIRWQLAVPEDYFESIIPGYELDTIALPLGMYPADESLLLSGEWQGMTYDHIGAFEVAGGPSVSPHSEAFDRLHIPRIQATQSEFDYWLGYFEQRPEERYVSDGDPTTVAVPESIDFSPAPSLGALEVIRYSG